ncbi:MULTISPECIES: hypothetical protein [Rhodopseudomonas]|uniref:Uncharacterized protein n=1 Tax=Rhodopseudomonas palustris TaxID=1076 RepID=A0A0D7EPC3_RHOPL|nr:MULTISPECIES: hypothetical protein [Rhodopseudomonas]KIZ41287.1 hypothetical protein OO17_15550 [Rhodopseudomonas palustris]MDF3810414.1 hypothetical protein [Rhodopseudomonas sp. BAL398]WOK19606.1 hypothetical protein RBJ75_08845 [Rhodopseudomonas sp. BAL398]
MADAAGWGRAFSRYGIVLLLVFLPNAASADSFVRNVRSGVETKVFSYHAHRRDCSEKAGVIRVVTKPQHGRLIPGREVSTLKRNRFNPEDACVGAQLNGFRVNYRSEPGYRGEDSFVIEYTLPRRSVTDYFTVIVR